MEEAATGRDDISTLRSALKQANKAEAARGRVRIVSPTGKPEDTKVIEPVSGNAIPGIRKITWESQPGRLAVATIEVLAAIDVMAEGTFVIKPRE